MVVLVVVVLETTFFLAATFATNVVTETFFTKAGLRTVFTVAAFLTDANFFLAFGLVVEGFAELAFIGFGLVVEPFAAKVEVVVGGTNTPVTTNALVGDVDPTEPADPVEFWMVAGRFTGKTVGVDPDNALATTSPTVDKTVVGAPETDATVEAPPPVTADKIGAVAG